MQGIDLFCGAGGMSIGAVASGVKVRHAVELNAAAAETFRINHPDTVLHHSDIRTVTAEHFTGISRKNQTVVFGGPPCQGFSTSNQKNRNKDNENNWLYREYIRVVRELMPDWLVFENVKGLIETESGFFLEEVLSEFQQLGYTTSYFVLNSVDFGVPQKRNRLFIIGSLHGKAVERPRPTVEAAVTVLEALSDLPDLENGNSTDLMHYSETPKFSYAKKLRGNLRLCCNNLVTNNAEPILARYKHIPPGGNWQDIPLELMSNYRDVTRCHTGIYHRLDPKAPSVVIGNFRKNMLVHPWKNRGLSVREAARLQSIPDKFRFTGSIGFQQQQVGNLVPPLMAEAVFGAVLKAAGEAN